MRMTGQERLDEEPTSAGCLGDLDCARYSICQLAHGCRCQVWGQCVLVRVVGQPCHTHYQCAVGLVCSDGSSRARSRCVPETRLEDLPRFADLPEPDTGAPPDIPATYGGPLLVAAISVALVVLCLVLAAWCRLTAPTAPARPSHHLPLHHPHSLPIPCYSSTQLFVQPHMTTQQ